jgi:competence protein ComFC
MTIKIAGNWHSGLAFDVHTLDSTYLGVDEYGHDRWENTRSDMGQLVYNLKYLGNRKTIPKIVKLLDKIKGIESMDGIIPIPPTNPARRIQPVVAIARALGEHRGVEVIEDALLKVPGGPELKNVQDPDERRALLEASLELSDEVDLRDADILLLDDLYRSGATLSVATDLLLTQGQVARVRVLTMTKTRSNR